MTIRLYYLLVASSLMAFAPAAMSQSGIHTPDLQKFVEQIDGRVEPDRLSQGKAIYRLLMHPELLEHGLSDDDAQVVAEEHQKIGEFDRFIRQFQRQAIAGFGQTYIQGKPPEQIDAIAAAHEIHRIHDAVLAEYEKRYRPILSRLSNNGRQFMLIEAIPTILAATRQRQLDYVLLAKAHPEFVRNLFHAGWHEVEARGGPFAGLESLSETDETLPTGITISRKSRIDY